MSSKKETSSPLLSVLIFSSGDTHLLHKSLLGLSKSITAKNISVVLNNNPPQELTLFMSTNKQFLDNNRVEFITNDIHGKRLTSIVGTEECSHILVLQEGDCLDTESLRKLIASSNNRVMTYPATRVIYHKDSLPNTVCDLPSFPTDISNARLATFSLSVITQTFMIPLNKDLYEYTLPDRKDDHSNPGWRIGIDLLDNSFSLQKVLETAVFSAKDSNHPKDKVWDTVPVNHFNDLASLRKIKYNELDRLALPTDIKGKIKHALKDNPRLSLIGQKTLHYNSILRARLPYLPQKRSNQLNKDADKWLVKSAEEVHLYNSRVFLSFDSNFHFKKITSNPLLNLGDIIHRSIQSLRHNTYDYVLVVPWLIAGGADMFFVNYANSVARLFPEKKVLIISTEPSRKSLSRDHLRISKDVDFIRLAELVDNGHDSHSLISQALASLIELVDARVIHIGLSDVGYKYVKRYSTAIKKAHRRIILTGYNEIITNKKREGYVHEIIPEIFDIADVITTDNQKIIDLWSTEYGLPTEKVLIHHQPFEVPSTHTKHTGVFSEQRPVKVLWAAHIRKEKNPTTYRAIAKGLEKDKRFTFTAFGAHDKAHYPLNPFLHPRQNFLAYKGGYKNFLKDIRPENFDIFVYTSLADGTPNILIEAGLVNLPIVSSSVGGIASLMKGDGTLIEDPEDAEAYIAKLEQFAKDPKLYYEKADSLRDRLIKTQTIESFDKEVGAMLRRINY